jgi:hypothetical protein
MERSPVAKTILKWELVGIPIIFLAGAVLHFLFAWSGLWHPIAWLAAVNESTWEHCKMAFWPGFFFALIEYAVIRKSAHNFWVGKSLGLVVIPVVIGVLFYGYKSVLGRSFLPFDLAIFFLAAAIAQLISYQFLTAAPLKVGLRRLAVIGMVVLVALFALATYYPPHAFLFEDPHTHQYGILDP